MRLKRRIHKNALFFISLSTDELHEIVDIGWEKLKCELDTSTEQSQLILDNCEQELNRRTDIKQAHELLGICENAINKVKRKSDHEVSEDGGEKLKNKTR